MFVTFENREIRDSCLLLKPDSINSNFQSEEIKTLRAIIADIKAAPRLHDIPLRYSYNKLSGSVIIEVDSIRIYCEVISTVKKPIDKEIARIKIVEIINLDLQRAKQNNQNFQ